MAILKKTATGEMTSSSVPIETTAGIALPDTAVTVGVVVTARGSTALVIIGLNGTPRFEIETAVVLEAGLVSGYVLNVWVVVIVDDAVENIVVTQAEVSWPDVMTWNPLLGQDDKLDRVEVQAEVAVVVMVVNGSKSSPYGNLAPTGWKAHWPS